jgi:hypothetical protein
VKTRIEIWVDADVPKDRIEELRKSLEDASWAMMHTWHRVAIDIMVQANEVPVPIPARGTREDYVR